MRRLLPCLLALGVDCAGSKPHAHEVAQTRIAQASAAASAGGGEETLLTMLAERDALEDETISTWYDPSILTANVRPEVLRSLEANVDPPALREPLGELTLYDLDLDIASGGRTFWLEERVYFQNRSSDTLEDLAFRMYANTVASGEGGPPEKLVRGHCVHAACTVETVGRDVILVHPAQPVAPGARLRVVFHVEGALEAIDPARTTMMGAATSSLKTLTSGGTGDHAGDYGLLAFGDDILSFANFYPVIARRAATGWDLDQSTLGDLGPDALSHVRAHVTVPASYVVAASGIVTRDVDADGRRHLDYAAGCIRDFALLASDKFTTAERLEGDVKVRSYFRASENPMGEKVLDTATWALKDFQKRFGAYPYRELDVVEQALVGGAGGVEFAGLATIASMFYKPSGNTTPGMEALFGTFLGAAEFTTAHEVAHQWWHGVVGSDSRLHPWQDEALAQFSAMLYNEDRYGVERAKREGDLNVRMGYDMMRLMGTPDGPVDVPAGHQSQLAYGGLVYGKGPYYFVALRKHLGDAAFFAALQAYAKQYYFGFAPGRALEDAMTRASGADGKPIAALSRRWLIESHGDDDLGKATMASLRMNGAGGAGSTDMMQILQQLAH